MPQSSSAEPGKMTRRKGARSVSTLSPTQLARKRANDREAQRAIRARTKEHIERLEAEVEELKSQHSAHTRVQELMRRNLALENENRRLRGEIGGSNSNVGPPPPSVAVTQAVGSITAIRLPYSTGSVYENSLTTASGIPSPFSSAGCSPLPDATSYAGAYMSIPSLTFTHHHHPHTHHSHQVGEPSPTLSSPTSATTDPDYTTTAGAAAAVPAAPYIRTLIPTSMK